MKTQKSEIKTFALLVLALFLLGACSSDEKNWQQAKLLMSAQGFEEFIANNPESEFLDSAQFYLEQIAFRESMEENTESGYLHFMDLWPNSVFSDSVYVLMEQLDFEETLEMNTVAGFIAFIEKYPDSRFLGDLQLEAEGETLPFKDDLMQVFRAVYSKSENKANFLSSHLTADGTVVGPDGRKTTYSGLDAVKEFSETDVENLFAEFNEFEPFIPVYIDNHLVLLSGAEGAKFKRLPDKQIQITEGSLFLLTLKE